METKEKVKEIDLYTYGGWREAGIEDKIEILARKLNEVIENLNKQKEEVGIENAGKLKQPHFQGGMIMNGKEEE